MSTPRKVSAVLWMAFFSTVCQCWFAFMEVAMLLYAINNHHYCIYYAGFGVAGLVSGFIAYRWRKRSEMRGMALAVHILFLVVSIIAFFIGLTFFLFMLWLMPTWSRS